MTFLTEQETAEIQRKMDNLADKLQVPRESQTSEWTQHFRVDTDLQGIKSMLVDKRTRLPYRCLPEWHDNEVLCALTQVETCIQKMEIKHNSSSYVSSVVKESVTAVMNTTLDEIRRGEILAGPSASALQVTVGMIAKQDILDSVFQRANLEALGSEIAIKKHVIAALASLLQREMMRSIDSLSGY